MPNISLGRQPILDSNSELCAYEILYSGGETILNRCTSATVINHVLNKFGTHALLGERRGFVKISEKFLMHDIIYSIPKEFFIFSILDEVEMTDRVCERLDALHAKGYLLAIDKFIINAESMHKYDHVLEKLAFVKVNITESSFPQLKEMIVKFHEEGIKVVADNVSELHEYTEAKELGCDWFQGYFFSKPKILENAAFEPSRMSVLKLYNLLMDDVSIDELTKEFELNYEITVQLLQFINSGSFAFRNKISSIHHILTLVGRMPLGQWLMLMIYSKSVSKSGHSPLMLMVKNRTELMENILKAVEPSARSNRIGEAYFVGVLSLMDTVFGVELEEILQHLNISEEVELALLYKEGVLGKIYQLVEDIEDFNTEAIHEFERKHHLEMEVVEHIALESMRSVNKFENPNAA